MGPEGTLRRNNTNGESGMKPPTWGFPAWPVDHLWNPSVSAKQMEPHSVTKIDCWDVVLTERQPGRSALMERDRLSK